jgi:histidinol-phosphate aminotransferase
MSEPILALDRNENFFPHHPDVVRALSQNASSASSYAQQNAQQKLQDSLAQFLNVPSSFVTLGHGGEDLLIKILTWQKQNASVLLRLNFSWQTYVTMAEGLNYQIDAIPCFENGNTFETPLDDIENHLRELHRPAVAILTTPNNPTGHTVSPQHIAHLAAQFPHHTFIVDAVYDAPQSAHIPTALEFHNVIVIGSFSKFFGLPGIRMGYAIGKQIPKAFQLILGFPQSTLDACQQALQNANDYTANRTEMLAFASKLAATNFSGLRVYASAASFVLVEILNPKISEATINRFIEQTRIRPKVFSHNQKRFLRWGLGPSAVNQRIFEFMKLLAEASESVTGAEVRAPF